MNKYAYVKGRIGKDLIESAKDYNRIHMPVNVFYNRECYCWDIQRRDESDRFVYVYVNEWKRTIEVWESYPDSVEKEVMLGIFTFDNFSKVSEFVFNCLFNFEDEEKKIDWVKLGMWIFLLTVGIAFWYVLAEIVMTVGN